jgi:PAS domain S-box-containing protein
MLFEQTALGVVLADGAGLVLDCNAGFCDLLGRPPAEIVGRPIASWTTDDDEGGGQSGVAAPASAPAPVWQARFLHADGSAKWLNVSILALGRDDDRYAAIVEDISERRRALDELGEKTAFLERAQEVARIGTYIADLRTRTLTLSPELARMFGAGEGPVVLGVEEYRIRFVHPDDLEETAGVADERYLRGEPAAWERRIVRADGEVIWVATNSSVEVDDQGRPLRTIGVVQDVTERARLVEDLRASRARIAGASERERRRLERDLHDGAQQRLMLIQLKLGLLRDSDAGEAVADELDDVIRDAEAAVEELRRLAHGIYPTVLRESAASATRCGRHPPPPPFPSRSETSAWGAARRASRSRSGSACSSRSRTPPSTPDAALASR